MGLKNKKNGVTWKMRYSSIIGGKTQKQMELDDDVKYPKSRVLQDIEKTVMKYPHAEVDLYRKKGKEWEKVGEYYFCNIDPTGKKRKQKRLSYGTRYLCYRTRYDWKRSK